MPRLPENDRLPMLDAHLGHWTLANALPGGPVVIPLNTTPPSSYLLADLQTDRETYEDKANEVLEFDETTLPILRSERDGIFGRNGDDEDGLWLRLAQYKLAVRFHVGRRHPLARTVPNLGTVTQAEYLRILQRFIDHWEKVNAATTTPFTLGTLTLAGLQAQRDALEEKIEAIGKAEASLDVTREEREVMFGDVTEEERADDSLITRLEEYHALVAAKFPGHSITTTLPHIFPTPPAPLPKFKYNWRDLGGGQLKTWLLDPGLSTPTTLYLQEGSVQQTKPFLPAPKDTLTVQTWTGITMVGELDVLELRDADGKTVARGVRDGGLGEPN